MTGTENLEELLRDGVVAAEGAVVLAERWFDQNERDPLANGKYCRLTDWIKKAKRLTIDNSPTSCGFGTAQPACILGVNKDQPIMTETEKQKMAQGIGEAEAILIKLRDAARGPGKHYVFMSIHDALSHLADAERHLALVSTKPA